MKKETTPIPWVPISVTAFVIILISYSIITFHILPISSNLERIEYKESTWVLGINDNKVAYEQPQNISEIEESLKITEKKKQELLTNGYLVTGSKYYQSFSSYYKTAINTNLPIIITTDSVLNYVYTQIERIKEDTKNNITQTYIKWLNDNIQYLHTLRTQTNDGYLTQAIDQNLEIFATAKNTSNNYTESFRELAENIRSASTIQKVLLNEYIKKTSIFSNTFQDIITYNDFLGISNSDLEISKTNNLIQTNNLFFKKITTTTNLEIEEDTEDINLPYFNNIFAEIEGYWSSNEQYTYRNEMIGEIYTVDIKDEGLTNTNSFENTIIFEKDTQLYSTLNKYLAQLQTSLEDTNILDERSEERLKKTIEILNKLNTQTITKEEIVSFFKEAGGVDNSDETTSILITNGIFLVDDTAYVGPVYTMLEQSDEDTQASILGASVYDSFKGKYDYTVRKQAKGTVRIPVLMYHNIAAMPKKGSSYVKGLYVTPSMFEQQMAYLKKKKYKTVTTQEFYDQLDSVQNPIYKTILLTFDDGTRGQYTSAYPILKKYGFTGTFYIISSKSPITAKEMKIMSDNGMVIDSHTQTHRDLKKLTKTKDLEAEIIQSKKDIENITGKTVVSIAYPGCTSNKNVQNIVRNAGYKLAFSCGTTIDHQKKYEMNLSRIHVFSDMYRFKKALSWGL